MSRNSGPIRQAQPSELAAQLAQIAHEAGKLILDHYEAGVEARRKVDRSPVTAADEEAEALIVKRLSEIAPGVPVIAEEAVSAGHKPEPGRKFFLVDPLDGTKEFLARNGEFTVNIGLIEDNIPIAGVVHAPALRRLFVGAQDCGAFEIPDVPEHELDLERAIPIRARKSPEDGLVAVASRTHRDHKTEEYLAHYRIKRFVAIGSSLKFCLVAAGEADIYPRHGRTMEWDSAAGHAVLAAAGGTVTRLDGTPLIYGNIETGFANPHFVARGR
ncbi:MAG: 3'(2'),5'-bisphosphate nucleotidase CysQ [Alphaproteobacteria bacterium]